MSIPAFASLLDIESQSEDLARPSRAAQRSSEPPTPYELDEFTWGSPKKDGAKSVTVNADVAGERAAQSGSHTPYAGPQTPYADSQTPNPLIPGNTSSPRPGIAAQLTHSFFYPRMNKWRVACACLIYMTHGLSDGAAGALIPSLEADYQIGYATVSLIFVTQAVGFIVTGFLVDTIARTLGRARALILSEAALAIAYLMLACRPPYGVVVFAYLLFGFGMAIDTSLNNVFLANLAHGTVILGSVHGAYGMGGIFGPIIATTMVSHGLLWSRFWLVVLGLRTLCIFAAGYTFWSFESEGPSQLQLALEREATNEPSSSQVLWLVLRNKVTLLGALFIFAYQGAEVSISGWIISFLINYRNGDPNQVGFVTAGFWAGVTAGRFFLTPLCQRFGERRSVYVLGIGAIGFELMVWLIPNIIGPSVAVAFVGLMLGPIYPCGQILFSRLLDHKLQTTGMSLISSAGSSGGAVAPFVTGLLASVAGTWVLHPITVGLLTIMLFNLSFLPHPVRRDE